MAEALCGPSNPLQNFHKHTAVDRSLQQDRLALPGLPTDSFRTFPHPGANGADAEFHAFQAGPAFAAPRLLANHGIFKPQYQPVPMSMPNWASEFQQLRITSPTTAYPRPAITRQIQPSNASTSSWHQDFLRSSSNVSANSTAFDQNFISPGFGGDFRSPLSFGPAHGYGTAFQPPVLRERAEEEQQQALFSNEFDLIQQELDTADSKGKQKEAVPTEATTEYQTPSGHDILSHADTQMGDVTGNYNYDRDALRWSEDVNVVDQLRTVRRDGGWEALETFERAHELELERSNSPLSRDIIGNIRQLRQEESHETHQVAGESSVVQDPVAFPSSSAGIRIGADTIPATQQQAEPASPEVEADELAKTAGQLLHNLRDEQSTKFQQSNFMELMRQLRDKEARIQGDNMVKQEPHPGGRYYPSDAFDTTQAPAAAGP